MSAATATAPASKPQPQEWDFFRACRALVSIDRGLKAGESRLSGLMQHRTLEHVLNETLGRPPQSRRPYAPFTERQLATVCHCSVRLMSDLLQDAVKRGLLGRLTPAQAKKRGLSGGHPQGSWYAVCLDNWATAPAYEPPKAALIVMPEPEPEEEPADEAVAEEPPRQPLLFRPGQKSRPFAWKSGAKRYVFDCTRMRSAVGVAPIYAFGKIIFQLFQQDTDETPEVDFMSERKAKVSSDGLEELIAAVSRAGAIPDDDAINRLVVECRKAARDATLDEIRYFVVAKTPQAQGKKNPMGFLCTVVPACFVGTSFALFRRERAGREAAERESRRQRIAELQRMRAGAAPEEARMIDDLLAELGCVDSPPTPGEA